MSQDHGFGPSQTPQVGLFEPYRGDRQEIQSLAEARHLAFVKQKNKVFGGEYTFLIDEYCQYQNYMLLEQGRLPTLLNAPPDASVYFPSATTVVILLPHEEPDELRTLYIAVQIGHLELHVTMPVTFPPSGLVYKMPQDSETATHIRQQAMDFAEAFLLPKKILKLPNDRKRRSEYIDDLAADRGVTTELVRHRVKTLFTAD